MAACWNHMGTFKNFDPWIPTLVWLIWSFSSVQSLCHVWIFATTWMAALQDSLSITNSQSSLKLTSIESVMPSSHLNLCRPLLLLPPIPPSIRVFSNESTLRMRWPEYWSVSFNISPSKAYESYSNIAELRYQLGISNSCLDDLDHTQWRTQEDVDKWKKI